MTPQEHNKFLAVSHFIYSGLYMLLGLGFVVFFWLMVTAIPDRPGHADGPPDMFLLLMGAFMFFFYGVLTVPSIVAGWGLLKRKSWAKTASIIAGVLAAMQFPIGTAVCVYTFWFLFSDPGKILYDKPPGQLAAEQQIYPNTNDYTRSKDYVPRTPPDWR